MIVIGKKPRPVTLHHGRPPDPRRNIEGTWEMILNISDLEKAGSAKLSRVARGKMMEQSLPV